MPLTSRAALASLIISLALPGLAVAQAPAPPLDRYDTWWSGSLLARASLPRAHELRAVGRTRVYTVERDEYDVEYVRAYPLRK